MKTYIYESVELRTANHSVSRGLLGKSWGDMAEDVSICTKSTRSPWWQKYIIYSLRLLVMLYPRLRFAMWLVSLVQDITGLETSFTEPHVRRIGTGSKLCNGKIHAQASKKSGTDTALAFKLLLIGQKTNRLTVVCK